MDALRLEDHNRNFYVAKTGSAELDQALWSAFRLGNRQALDQIFNHYARALYSYGRSITADTALISDCIQDVFVELWVKRENLSDRIAVLKFYLIKSLRRRILRRLSSDKRLLGDQEIPDDYDYAVEFNIELSLIQEQTSHEVATRLKGSLSELSARQQEAVYLKFYENLSYEEIALILNTNIKAVYNLIGKSIILLRQRLKT